MASDDELLKAIDTAVGAGNLDAAKEIALMLKQQRMRNEPLPQYKLGQEGMPDAIKSTVRDDFGVGAQRMAGAGAAPMIAGHAIAQLGGADNKADIENWRGVSNATPNTMGGNLVGNAAMFGAAPISSVGKLSAALGAKALPRYGQIADMAATQGGIGAAATPGDAGERLLSGALGMTGTAAPAMLGVGQTTRRVLTKEGNRLDLAESLRRELGPEAGTLEKSLYGKYPGESYGVQPSAAMLTRNPTLEVMETGSRVRTGDQWKGFDRDNARARWTALENAAGSPEELTKLRAARDALTTPVREEALGTMGGTFYGTGHKLEPLAAKLDEFATGANRPNKDVQTMVSYVKGELDKGATPDQLYTIRKVLTDGIAAGPTSELSQAARAARPQRMEIIGQIDTALNDMSNGLWENYLKTYKLSSPLISSKTALQKMTDALSSGRPAGAVPLSMGEQPAPLTLGKLNERFGTKTFGSKEFDQLTPQHRELVDALMSDLSSQAGVMSSKSILGSPTAPFAANAGRVSAATNGAIDAAGNLIPIAGGTLAATAKGSMARRSEETLADLLKNPKALAEALRKAKKAQDLLDESGRVGAGAGAAIRSRRE